MGQPRLRFTFSRRSRRSLAAGAAGGTAATVVTLGLRNPYVRPALLVALAVAVAVSAAATVTSARLSRWAQRPPGVGTDLPRPLRSRAARPIVVGMLARADAAGQLDAWVTLLDTYGTGQLHASRRMLAEATSAAEAGLSRTTIMSHGVIGLGDAADAVSTYARDTGALIRRLAAHTHAAHAKHGDQVLTDIDPHAYLTILADPADPDATVGDHAWHLTLPAPADMFDVPADVADTLPRVLDAAGTVPDALTVSRQLAVGR